MTDDLAPNPAYEAALRSERLTPDQWRIWALLFSHRVLSTRNLGVYLSPDPDPTLLDRLVEMERLGFVTKIDNGLSVFWWSAVEALDQLPVAPAPPPPGRQELIQRFQVSIVTEIEDGIADADPVAFVARWKSALREVGAR